MRQIWALCIGLVVAGGCGGLGMRMEGPAPRSSNQRTVLSPSDAACREGPARGPGCTQKADGAEAVLQQAIALGAKVDKGDQWIVLRILRLSEDDLIKGLSVFLKYSRGTFPAALDGHTPESEMERLTRPLVKGGELKPDERTRKELSNILFAEMFYNKLIREGRQVNYYGSTVTVQDRDRVLIRWTTESKDMYRVIYGDLRAENMDAAHMMELESPK